MWLLCKFFHFYFSRSKAIKFYSLYRDRYNLVPRSTQTRPHMCEGCCLKYVLHKDFWLKSSYQARTTHRINTFHWIFTYITLVKTSTENFDIDHTGKEPREWLGWTVWGLFRGVCNCLCPRRSLSLLFSVYWVYCPGCQAVRACRWALVSI